MPSTVEIIGASAFYRCKKFKQIIFPASVKYIGESAINRLSALRDIVCLGTVPPEVPQKSNQKISTGTITILS